MIYEEEEHTLGEGGSMFSPIFSGKITLIWIWLESGNPPDVSTRCARGCSEPPRVRYHEDINQRPKNIIFSLWLLNLWRDCVLGCTGLPLGQHLSDGHLLEVLLVSRTQKLVPDPKTRRGTETKGLFINDVIILKALHSLEPLHQSSHPECHYSVFW